MKLLMCACLLLRYYLLGMCTIVYEPTKPAGKNVKGTDLPHIITAAKAIIEIQSGPGLHHKCNEIVRN